MAYTWPDVGCIPDQGRDEQICEQLGAYKKNEEKNSFCSIKH